MTRYLILAFMIVLFAGEVGGEPPKTSNPKAPPALDLSATKAELAEVEKAVVAKEKELTELKAKALDLYLSATKAELAEVEKAVVAKAKELAELKAKVATLNAEFRGENVGKQKVCTEPLELFADIPQDVLPKDIKASNSERAAAEIWCAKNVARRTIEFKLAVDDVTGSEQDGEYRVEVAYKPLAPKSTDSDPFFTYPRFGKRFEIGKQKAAAVVAGSFIHWFDKKIIYTRCTEAEYKKMLAFKGHEVSARAILDGVKVEMRHASPADGFTDEEVAARVKVIVFQISILEPSLDGFLPASHKNLQANRADNVTIKTAANLLKDLPKDAYPVGGKAGAIERSAAQVWCRQNLIGKYVEWDAAVDDVNVDGDGPFQVQLRLKLPSATIPNVGVGCLFGEMLSLGKSRCEVIVGNGGEDTELKSACVTYLGCSTVEAKQLRDLKGKTVTFRAQIKDFKVCDKGDLWSRDELKVEREINLPFFVEVSKPSANKLLPKRYQGDK